MGRPKQALPVLGGPLLGVTARKIIAAKISRLIVVLGSNHRALYPMLNGIGAKVITHPSWAEGMGGTIKFGLACALAIGDGPKGILISVCDQPYLDTAHIDKLVETFQNGAYPAVASQYAHTLGVPAIFAEGLFPDLMAMEDGSGAKKLIRQLGDRVFPVSMSCGEVDLDTPEDYERYKKATGL